MTPWTLTEYAELFKVKLPTPIYLTDLGIKTSRELREWVDKDAEKTSDVEYPEGYVVYWAGKPSAKVKNSKYMAAFHVSGGNRGHAKNAIIELVFTEKLDDVYPMMIPELQQFANKIKERVAGLGIDVLKAGRLIADEKCLTQKDFALAVQRNCSNRQLHAFFYTNKEKVMAGQNLSDLYTQWIKVYYMRFLDLWKEKEEA